MNHRQPNGVPDGRDATVRRYEVHPLQFLEQSIAFLRSGRTAVFILFGRKEPCGNPRASFDEVQLHFDHKAKLL